MSKGIYFIDLQAGNYKYFDCSMSLLSKSAYDVFKDEDSFWVVHQVELSGSMAVGQLHVGGIAVVQG